MEFFLECFVTVLWSLVGIAVVYIGWGRYTDWRYANSHKMVEPDLHLLDGKLRTWSVSRGL